MKLTLEQWAQFQKATEIPLRPELYPSLEDWFAHFRLMVGVDWVDEVEPSDIPSDIPSKEREEWEKNCVEGLFSGRVWAPPNPNLYAKRARDFFLKLAESEKRGPVSENVFRLRGHLVEIKYQGKTIDPPLKASMGMKYIVYLLGHPGQEFSTPIALETCLKGEPVLDTKQEYRKMAVEDSQDRIRIAGKVAAERRIHDKSKKELGEELRDAMICRDKAKDMGDTSQTQVWTVEIERIGGLLKADIAARKRGHEWSPEERLAYDRIRQAIKRSIQAIKKESKPLAAHLKQCLGHLSFPLRYDPSPPINWLT